MTLEDGYILRNRYKIIRRLGNGSFGETYLAEDLDNLPDKVVVKRLMIESFAPTLLKKAQELFTREAEALYKLGKYTQTPHLKAHFEEDNQFFLVMEYVAEQNMSELELREGNILSEKEVIDLLSDILEIVKIVHEHNLIHRDIKPDNLIRQSEKGQIVLIDFGSVTSVLNFEESTKQVKDYYRTRTGNSGYAAPEQLSGKSYPCSDIYAVGMIGIQALTGLQPLSVLSLWQNLTPTTSEQLKQIIRKMTAYNASERYQSAEEVLKDLKEVSREPIEDSPPIPNTPFFFKELIKPKKWLIGLSIVPLVVTLLVLKLWWDYLHNYNTHFVLKPEAQEAHFPNPNPFDIPAGTKINIKGSINTLYQDQQFKKRFESKFIKTTVDIERDPKKNQLGTENGIKLLCAGEIDIAAASSLANVTQCPDGKKLFHITIGTDYISIVVRRDNPIKGLSKEQVKAIFQCKYIKWNELDPSLPKEEIKVINRPPVSGTNEDFKRLFLDGQEFCPPNSPNFKNFRTLKIDEITNLTKNFKQYDISYLGYGLAESQPGTYRILPVEGALPNQSLLGKRSLYYVYKGKDKETPDSETVKQFLGFVQHQN